MIELLMLVRNEATMLPRSLPELARLADRWTLVDTGSSDDTPDVACDLLARIPGRLHRRPWHGFAHNRNELFQLAHGDDWLLLWDADWQPLVHPGLKAWLAGDPVPEAQAWMVEIRDRGLAWWLPQLLRGRRPWRFQGDAHACLANPITHRKLRGLAAYHMRAGGGGDSTARLQRNLEALHTAFGAGDPRATFYTAETLRDLGRVDEAIDAYRKRAAMNGWEEEAWWAAYQAGRLAGDVDELLAAHRRRPWRHEPLTAAAHILANRENSDVLFQEQL